FNVEGVDGVLYANLVAAKQFAAIGEGSLGAVGSCYANSAGPLTTPDRHGVIEYVGAVDIVDVRRPDSPLGLKAGAGLIGKGGTHEGPVHQVRRAENGSISGIFGGIEVEVTILCPDYRRIGEAPVDHRIPVDHVLVLG